MCYACKLRPVYVILSFPEPMSRMKSSIWQTPTSHKLPKGDQSSNPKAWVQLPSTDVFLRGGHRHLHDCERGKGYGSCMGRGRKEGEYRDEASGPPLHACPRVFSSRGKRMSYRADLAVPQTAYSPGMPGMPSF